MGAFPETAFACNTRADGLHLEDRPGFDALIAQHPGRRLEMLLRELRGVRTIKQNRYYFGVVLALLAEHKGYDFDTAAEREAFHDLVAYRFLRLPDDPVTGSPRRERTPSKDPDAFWRYIERIRRWAAEEGCDIPDPHGAPEPLAWRGESGW